MAIDPRIALAGQGVNLQQAITGGLQQGEMIRQSGLRDQLLRNQVVLQNQAINKGAIGQALESMKQFGNVIDGLASIPDMAQRAKILAQNAPMLEELGIPTAKLTSMDLSDAGLKNVQASLAPFMQRQQQDATAGMREFQFYQGVLNDPNATEEQKRAARIQLGTEARAGRMQTQEVSPGVFQTFDPNQGAIGDPYKINDQGERVALTRQEQQGLRLGEDVQRVETIGQAETAVALEREQQVSEIRLAEQQETSRRERAGALLDDMATRNQNAARQQVRLIEAMQLAKTADQGLTGGVKLQLSRFPFLSGIDVSDTAALDSALKSIAIEQLQAFKGPTTDFEFDVVQNISGNILDSETANKARIASLQRAAWFQRKEAEQARRFILNGGDPRDFAFNFDEIISDKLGGITLRDLQDTAVRNDATIEEVLKIINEGK